MIIASTAKFLIRSDFIFSTALAGMFLIIGTILGIPAPINSLIAVLKFFTSYKCGFTREMAIIIGLVRALSAVVVSKIS